MQTKQTKGTQQKCALQKCVCMRVYLTQSIYIYMCMNNEQQCCAIGEPGCRLRVARSGVRTLRHQDTSAPVPKFPSDISAPVPKCLGHFGTDHRGSHACQWRQLRSGRGGELKAVDVYVPLSLNCGF